MMDANLITKEDLNLFKQSLLSEIREIIGSQPQVSNPIDPKWVKSGPVRKILGISHDTLQVLRIKDLLHPKKVNGRYYYNMKEVNDLFIKTK